MSDFLSRASGSRSDMVARKEAIMNNVKTELAIANAQELVNKSGERCYAKCVTKPGDSLSSSEETCLTKCFERYMEAFNIVSRTYVSRLGRERSDKLGTQAEML